MWGGRESDTEDPNGFTGPESTTGVGLVSLKTPGENPVDKACTRYKRTGERVSLVRIQVLSQNTA